MLHLALFSRTATASALSTPPAALYELDPTWTPTVPASLAASITGVSSAAVLGDSIFVGQRGAAPPLIVLDRTSGAFKGTYGSGTISKMHGLKVAVNGAAAGGYELWATDCKASALVAYSIDTATGALTEIETVGTHGTAGKSSGEIEFGSVADLASDPSGTSIFVSDGDGGCNARVMQLKRMSTGGSNGVWKETWINGNNGTMASPALDVKWSSPHSLAYDPAGKVVYVADRNAQTVVALDGETGKALDGNWSLKECLAPSFAGDASTLGVWSIRIANGHAFVGVGALKNATLFDGHIAVIPLPSKTKTNSKGWQIICFIYISVSLNTSLI